jgi:hypothetical protein
VLGDEILNRLADVVLIIGERSVDISRAHHGAAQLHPLVVRFLVHKPLPFHKR